MLDPSKKGALTQEIQRLKAKKSAVDDRDIKQALQLKIDALQVELEAEDAKAAARLVAETEERERPESTEPSSPEQIRKADELIRQARVEKMRKNGARALALMKEASEVAPNAPAVLEALGDDYTEQRRYKDAVAVYGRALKFAKGNIELERKHANTILRSQGISIDTGFRMDGGDSLLPTAQNTTARIGTARILNAFMPGLGHLVIGKTIQGVVLLVLTIVWIVWIASLSKDINALLHMVVGRSSQPNLLVLLPVFGYLITWLIGITSLGSDPSQKLSGKSRVTRMEPPVNLPFE